MAWTYFHGRWLEGNPGILGAMSQATWLASMVFDGARAFDGMIPDIERHCARCIRSAKAMGLIPTKTTEEILEIAIAAIERFPPGTELYIRPMFWAEQGGAVLEPDSTEFALTAYEEPLPPPDGFSATLSPIKRPLPDTMVTGAKASCLYPAIGRALAKARKDGFDSLVVCDAHDQLAEFATANLFMVKDGTVFTPADDDCYLSGITRQRVMKLLNNDGIKVVEKTLNYADLQTADEAFSTGNHGKILPMNRLDGDQFDIGPVFKRVRELYWDFAATSKHVS